MENFEIKPYSVKELGLLYFPHVSPNSASQQLMRWVNKNRFLKEELVGTDYQPGQKLLTPRQVKVIIKHLGEP